MNLAGAPVTGQHSRSILAGIGYSAEEIDDLIAAGVVGGRRPPGRGLSPRASPTGHAGTLTVATIACNLLNV